MILSPRPGTVSSLLSYNTPGYNRFGYSTIFLPWNFTKELIIGKLSFFYNSNVKLSLYNIVHLYGHQICYKGTALYVESEMRALKKNIIIS